MSKLDIKAYRISTLCNHGYWQDRALSQIQFAAGLSALRGGKYDKLVESAEDFLLNRWEKEKTVTPDAARQAEAMLLPLSEDAKSFTLHCVSHAHIDMNWMWRFDETVTVALDTFRTMLDLLAEYPQFTFSQSQASVYRIVEEYGPAGMLDSIRKYVQEGRWEVTASTWVEADKNTPSGESMARHLLYTKRYLHRLLGLAPDAVRLDFEPDTFGHSANVPEILAEAGVEYYYHCRGSLDPHLCWWEAPSGKRMLSLCDPVGYNCVVEPDFAVSMLASCRDLGVDTLLKVYGVGDHGGGPSRRDIERLLDMQSWPVYPTILFSTYHAFFDEFKRKYGDSLPVRQTEMNAIFTGCYTTQTRIKTANRVGEATLQEAELFGTLAASSGFPYPLERLETAWQKVLFNQFHDILTGSGTVDTREYAMGQFQQAMGAANTEKANALRALSAATDTSRYQTEEDSLLTRSEGAGVGSGVAGFKVTQVGRNRGSLRIFQVFNPSPYDREGLAEITVWDWPASQVPLMEFRDEEDNILPHQRLTNGNEGYWGHEFVTVVVPVKVPAGGYATYTLRESADHLIPPVGHEPGEWQKIEVPHRYVLENDRIRVAFDTQQGSIISFFDKDTGKERLRPGCRGGFRVIEEDTDRGMTSWRVGRYMNIRELDSVHIQPVYRPGEPLIQSISIRAAFGRSTLHAVFSVEKGSPLLHIAAECDWYEKGMPGVSIPQLNFALPLEGEHDRYLYDIPSGTLARPAVDMDQPGNSFIATLPGRGEPAFLLTCDCRYGFRGFDNTLSVALIRGSYELDPNPEYGMNRFQLAAGPAGNAPADLVRLAFDRWHPFSVLSATAHPGTRPLHASLCRLEGGDVILQAVKMAEDGSRTAVVRLYGAETGGRAILTLGVPTGVAAELADLLEKGCGKTLPITDGCLEANVAVGEVVTLRIPLA